MVSLLQSNKFLLLVLCLLSSKVIATEDYYFSLCSGIIATNAAYTCKGDGDGEQNVTCQCTDNNFARSLYLCINESSRYANVSQGVNSSWGAYRSACRSVNIDAPILTQVEQSLQAVPMNQTYAQANVTKAGGFQIPIDMLVESNIPQAGINIHRQGYICVHWGEGLIGYIMGIMAIQILLNISSWFLPGFTRVVQNSTPGKLFRRFVTMPALFNAEQAEPLEVMGHWPLVFPLRIHAILIAGLYACVIAFLAADFSVATSPYGSDTKSAYIALWLCFRAGWFAMYLLVPTFLFAGRNNFLIWMTGWQFSTFLVWHKHLARLSTLLIIIHASAMTILMKEHGFYSEAWKRNYFVMGFVALLTMSIACVQAVKFLRARGYDLFIHIHFSLAVVTCAGIWRHLRRPDVCYEMLYTMIAVWGFDRLCRIIRIVLNKPGSICEVRDYGDIVMLKIRFSNIWKPTAGSYVFVHFLHPLLFTQSHPFTALYRSAEDDLIEGDKGYETGSIDKYPTKELANQPTNQPCGGGYIKLLIRKQQGITKRIAEKQNWRVLIDGPYGVQFNMAPYHEMVFVAGGIGITGVFSHLKHAITYNSGNLQSVSLYWSVRDLSALMWFHEELVEMSNIPMLNIHLHISTYTGEPYHRHFFRNYLHTNKHIFSNDHENSKMLSHWEKDDKLGDIVRHSKINISDLVLDHIANSRGPVCFFSCGPGRMCDDVRRAVTANITRTRSYVQYYEEAFAF